MVLIDRIVGVMLPGAPTAADPRGVADATERRALNLTPAVGVVLRAQRVNTVAWIEAMVQTDFGTFKDRFREDQTKQTPNSWFTAPMIDV